MARNAVVGHYVRLWRRMDEGSLDSRLSDRCEFRRRRRAIKSMEVKWAGGCGYADRELHSAVKSV
jgi:hypothetical protein